MSECGAKLIAKERRRQIKEEGWTAEHDAMHTDGELAMAACCYAMPERLYAKRGGEDMLPGFCFIDPWPWDDIPGSRYRGDWDKRKVMAEGNYPLWPEELSPEQRIELLIKAGALAAAEIDRLQALKKEGE